MGVVPDRDGTAPAGEPFDLRFAVEAGAGGGGPLDTVGYVRLRQFSPDAPAVDVTTEPGSAQFHGIPFGESGRIDVDAGEYTVQIRGERESDDGDAVANFDLALSGNGVYTAVAGGYLSPEEEPTEEPFDLTVVGGATVYHHLQGSPVEGPIHRP